MDDRTEPEHETIRRVGGADDTHPLEDPALDPGAAAESEHESIRRAGGLEGDEAEASDLGR